MHSRIITAIHGKGWWNVKIEKQHLSLACMIWRILRRNLDFVTFEVPSSLAIYIERME